MLDEVQNSLPFVLLGFEAIVVTLNATAIRAGLAAILSVKLVRLAVVALCLAIVRVCQSQFRSSVKTLTWGGLRRGLSFALALLVPKTLGQTQTGEWIFEAATRNLGPQFVVLSRQ